MKRNSWSFLLISAAVGTLCGELLGIVLIMRSNGQLLWEQATIARLGYIAVPGQFFFPEMKAFTTYLAGGLFFALSIGLAYGFCCGLLFWLFSLNQKWYKKRGSQYLSLLPFVFLLVVLLIGKNGTDPFVHLFFLLVPLILWFISFRMLSPESIRFVDVIRYGSLLVIFLFLLGIIVWNGNFTGNNNYIINFTEIRDRLLLPTKTGQKVDEFYYRYTLYPARLIKPLFNRLQNVIHLDPQGFSQARISQIRSVLKRYDWFPVISDENDHPVQSRLSKAEGDSEEIIFYRRTKPMYHISYQEFLKDPSKHLKKYSECVYIFDPLRIGCGLSLFIVIPLALIFGLFLCCIGFIRWIFSLGRITLDRIRETVIMLVVIFILFGTLNFSCTSRRDLPMNVPDLWLIAGAEEQGDRLGALYRLDKLLAVRSYHDYKGKIIPLVKDPNPVVRRYGAKFLGKMANGTDDKDEIFSLLRFLLRDSNINVVYTAATALGELHIPRARDTLLEILHSNRKWYLKMRAYYALKNSGWRQ